MQGRQSIKKASGQDSLASVAIGRSVPRNAWADKHEELVSELAKGLVTEYSELIKREIIRVGRIVSEITVSVLVVLEETSC